MQTQGAVAAEPLGDGSSADVERGTAAFNVSLSIMIFLAKASRLRQVSRAFW